MKTKMTAQQLLSIVLNILHKKKHNLFELHFFIFIAFFIMNNEPLMSQTTISYRKHIDNVPIRKVIGFVYSGSDKCGVKIRSGYFGTGSVAVEMRAPNDAAIGYSCNVPLLGMVPIVGTIYNQIVVALRNDMMPANFILYKTTVNGNFPGVIDKGIGDALGGTVLVYNSDSFVNCEQIYNWNPVGSSIKTNSPMFYKRNCQTWEQMHNISKFINITAPQWHRMWRGSFPVDVTLTFSGDMTLNDVEEIILPGIRLTPSDFSIDGDYPLSSGLDSSLNVSSVEFSLQKNVEGVSVTIDNTNYNYTGTFQDMWLSEKPIPNYSQVPEKPYRVELKEINSGNNGGYGNFTNASDLIVPVYAKNNTETENLKLHASIKVNNFSYDQDLDGVVQTTIHPYTYSVWLNYNRDMVDGRQSFNQIFLDGAHSFNELVAQGYSTDGKTIEIDMTIPKNSSLPDIMGGIANRRLRIAVKKTTNPTDYPTAAETIAIGEVEDYTIQFKKSTCSDGSDIPYEYLVYSQDILPYCGPILNGNLSYSVALDSKADSYQREIGSNLFKTKKVSDYPFALSKHTKTAYAGDAGPLPLVLGSMVSGSPSIFAVEWNKDDFDPLINPNAAKGAVSGGFTYTISAQDVSSPENFDDKILYTDIYYPEPIYDKLMPELDPLPLIIWMPGGGFVWNTRKASLVDQVCIWLAQRGFVVAAIDYRQGAYYEKEIIKRTGIAAWQDSRTAVKWWKASGIAEKYNNSNNPMWKVDTNKIYGAGSSAGGISVMHNAVLTPEMFSNEVETGRLPAIKGGYPISGYTGGLFGSTFDMRPYESIPCIETIHGNTCDILSRSTRNNPSTNLPFWGSPVSDPHNLNDPGHSLTASQRSDLTQMLNEFNSKDGTFNNVISVGGAINEKDWFINNTNRPPIVDIHHIEDGVVPCDSGLFFEFSSVIKAIAIAGGWKKLHGGLALEKELKESNLTSDNFNFLKIKGPEKGGWGMNYNASTPYHLGMYKFGGSSSNDVANGAPVILEEKVMNFMAAWFTKNWQTNDQSRLSNQTNAIKTEKGQNIPNYNSFLEQNFSIYPNPSKGTINLNYKLTMAGKVNIHIYDMLGRDVLTKTVKHSTIGMQNIALDLSNKNGLYIVKVTTPTEIYSAKLIIEH